MLVTFLQKYEAVLVKVELKKKKFLRPSRDLEFRDLLFWVLASIFVVIYASKIL